MHRFIFYSLLFGLCVTVGTVASVLIWGIETQPYLIEKPVLDHSHVRRLKNVLKANDFRRMSPGEIRQAKLSAEDINLILGHGLTDKLGAEGHMSLSNRGGRLQLSTDLSQLPPLKQYFNRHAIDKRYVNIDIQVLQQEKQQGQVFVIQSLKIGQLSIPSHFANNLVTLSHSLLNISLPDYQKLWEGIHRIELQQDQLQVTYQWQPALLKHLQGLASLFQGEPELQEQLAFYQHQLSLLVKTLPYRSSLQQLLQPLFSEAVKRSQTPEEAIDENKAIILTLSFYLARFNPLPLLPESAVKHLRFVSPRLQQRFDLAQHFTYSSLLTATAGTSLANIAGLFKELEDSMGGSGFSFADLAADQAGVRFAILATHTDTAQSLQHIMATSSGEQAFMPSIDQLPEGVQELDFKARYKNLGSEEFSIMQKEIDQRLAACELYQQLPTL